jgi:putative hemolysin
MNQEINIRNLIKSKNPRLLKWIPGFIIRYLERILHQEEINVFLASCADKQDEDFCDSTMEFLDLKVEVKGKENLPKEGKLVFAMNHPLGGLDAIALVSGLRYEVKNIKFIVNDLLLQLGKMNGLFLGIDKFGKNSMNKREQINELFASDNVVCIFPAGLVSRRNSGTIADLEWKKSFVTLSKKNERIIIPIHIEGRLSPFFYGLSNLRKKLGIKANIEMLYLSDELFKLKGTKIVFTIGQPIHDVDFDESKGDRAIAQSVKRKVYELGD